MKSKTRNKELNFSSNLSKTRSKISRSEKQIENEILATLKYIPHCKAWKNQSVGIYDPTKKTFRTRSKYQLKGVSDILGIYRGRMFCFEVKSEKGRLTEDQMVFLNQMHELGAIAACVRSVDDVLALLEQSHGPIRFHS